jgi:hypothetical protein
MSLSAHFSHTCFYPNKLIITIGITKQKDMSRGTDYSLLFGTDYILLFGTDYCLLFRERIWLISFFYKIYIMVHGSRNIK